MPGGSLTVDSDDLVTLHTRLTTINGDMAKLGSLIEKVTDRLGKAGKASGAVFGSAGGGKGSTITAAPVSAFGGGGGSSAGRALAFGAVSEVGASWAGSINSAMARLARTAACSGATAQRIS